MLDKIKSVMIGHAVGDALGVPVEFASREEIAENPVTNMEGFGTYPYPAGTWSDDTCMSLGALDCLAGGEIDWDKIMDNFGKWLDDGKYTLPVKRLMLVAPA
jgi:ADP-ribosylglycohydrolase